jgi:hypothetical protein
MYIFIKMTRLAGYRAALRPTHTPAGMPPLQQWQSEQPLGEAQVPVYEHHYDL